MSMLGAFLRGAAGQGLLGVVDRMDRADAAAAEEERRRREREEDKAWRSEQAELDRQARAELLRERLETSGGGSSRSGSGGGSGGGGGTDYRVQALMEKYKISEGRARKLVAAGEADENPLSMPVGGDGVGPPQVDQNTWAEVNATIAKALRDGPSMARSNYEQLTAGDINAQRRDVNQGMLDGRLTMPQVAEANAAMSGGGAFKNARTNEFTGTPTAIGKSEIAENYAQAGSANRANRDKPDSNKPDLSWLKKEYENVTNEIAKARASGDFDPKGNPEQQALLDRALDIEGRLMAGGQPVDNKAIGGAVAAVLAAAREAKGGSAPAGRASEPPPRQANPDERKSPGMLKATTADPLAGLSRQAIREKRADLVKELQRWQKNPNAKARVAEIQELIDRIDQGRY